MKYIDGRVMHIGDTVLFQKKMLGTVQAVLDLREFSPVLDPSEFSGMETGLMVEFHDGSSLFFEELPEDLMLLKRNSSYADEVREDIIKRNPGEPVLVPLPDTADIPEHQLW